MSRTCDQEMCPMWDGVGCPCEMFGINPENPPTSGTWALEAPKDDEEES